jgi:oligopeptide transport system ATP-binding protein
MPEKLIEVKDLKKYYPIRRGLLSRHVADVRAVDGVSFDLGQGETLGLVGESGCGKSSLGRALLLLEKPTAGEIIYQGADITKWDKKQLYRLRREAQMIFQDPQSSLDPRMTVGDSVGEALLVKGFGDERERTAKTHELLQRVGLEAGHAARYPHELSGGQKQRIGIARALAVDPHFIVADEPVSALDVSVQAQILNLLIDLQHDLGLTYLFIAHDLSVIWQVSDRVAVMYLGQIVELAAREELFAYPLHPYTRALLSAVNLPGGGPGQKIIAGEVPSAAAPPPGCRFHTRCPAKTAVCTQEVPAFREVRPAHWAACHLCQ